MLARISLTITLFLALTLPAVMPQAGTVAAPANLTPTPEPTAIWDQSDLHVTGFCNHGAPTFKVNNAGAAMAGPVNYLFTNSQVSESVCNNLDNTEDGSGSLQLAAGEAITLTWPDTVAEPPYSLCVQQRPGFPGISYIAATIGLQDTCPTAEDPVAEPGVRTRYVFIPRLDK